MLKPSVPFNTQFTIPEHIRVNNPGLVKFLNYYYEWLSTSGGLNFIRNVLELRDVDTEDEQFIDLNVQNILKVLPSNVTVDKKLLTKNLRQFFRAKGTENSYEFLLNALFGESAAIKWYSDQVFKASDNSYSNKNIIAVEDVDLSNTEGLVIYQEDPDAHATIEQVTQRFYGEKLINFVQLNPKTITGNFLINKSVKVLSSSVDRSYFEVTEYYKAQSVFNGIITIWNSTKDTSYKDLIIKELGSNFEAKVAEVLSQFTVNYINFTQLRVTDMSGDFKSNGEVYFINESLKDSHFTKDAWLRGKISPAITGIKVEEAGSYYSPGDPVVFLMGSGEGADAKISTVSGGSIDQVLVVSKGFGYSVGDEILAAKDTAYGAGFSAEVSSIDGHDAKAQCLLELEGLVLRSQGSGMSVGDTLEVPGGVLSDGSAAKITVASVSTDTALSFTGATIQTAGHGYSYTQIKLTNAAMTSVIAGFTAQAIVIGSGQISQVLISAVPASTTGTEKIIVNGVGATATASLTSGGISSITVSTGGINYVDPVVEVIDSGTNKGSGFIGRVNVTGGVVTTVDVIASGENYVAPIVTIRERNGTGAVIVPTFSIGGVLTYTITERGSYSTLPECYNVPLLKVTTAGREDTGVRASLMFRLKSISLEAPGKHYYIGANSTNLLADLGSALLQENGDNLLINSNTIDCYTVGGIGTGASFDFSVTSGAVSAVRLYDGGSGYPENVLLTLTNTVGSGASFLLTVSDGRIVAVDLLHGGSGYVAADVDNGIFTIEGNGIPAQLSATAVGTGEVLTATVTANGSGYYDPLELTPLTLTVSGTGSGAVILPILEAGAIINVKVLNGGSGYTGSPTINVTGGGGSGAALTPLVFNGRIVGATIGNGGSNYKYGTKIYVIGDGSGAVLTPVVETGITDIVIFDGGASWDPTTVVTVSDSMGTGFEGYAIRDEQGTIVGIDIVNSGSGYVDPELVITGTGTPITYKINLNRGIKSINVTSGGSNYEYAELFILGDGSGAKGTVLLDAIGSIDSVSMSYPGTKYTSTPTVVIEDTSGHGSVTGIRLIDRGSNYTKLPIVYLPSKYDTFGNLIAGETKFVAMGNKIGAVKMIGFNSFGAEYHDEPIPIFPLNVIVKQPVPFQVGETVSVEGYPYVNDYLLTLNGDRLITEDSELLVATNRMNEPIATIKRFDIERQLLQLEVSDSFYLGMESTLPTIEVPTSFYLTVDDGYLLTEDGDHIVESIVTLPGEAVDNDTNTDTFITEEGLQIVHELSNGISLGDVIVGTSSGARATIIATNRASGDATAGAIGKTIPKFQNSTGILNSPYSKLHDNARYQDHAYVVETGQSLDAYKLFLSKTVHPAGYKMFGDVVLQLFGSLPLTQNLDDLSDKIIIFLELMLVLLAKISVKAKHTYSELEEMKFNMFTTHTDALIYRSGNNATTFSAGFLLTEDGDMIITENTSTAYGGPNIDQFMSLVFDNVDNPTDPLYHEYFDYIDGAEISIIV